ncbi:MAG TPA: M24 family metallopeptidase [Phycisphaerales bacterium]|nr:M24 family metallopeptidase [Phycisphaerales bacterium]
MTSRIAIPKLTPAETDAAHASAEKVVQTHQRLVNFIRTGQTVAHIDAEVKRILEDLKCESCFKGYRIGRLPPYPSHACLSVNDCIVHGTVEHHSQPLVEGDILKIDIGVTFRGFNGDAAWTYAIKSASDVNKRLMQAGKESLKLGIAALKPGNTFLEYARAVQQCAETRYGFHCVEGLTGHGYGRRSEKDRGLHKPPHVWNEVPTHMNEWPEAMEPCAPGILIAVEPMIAVGTDRRRERGWAHFTADGSTAVHYEADVLITDKGPLNLTVEMEQLPDVVG